MKNSLLTLSFLLICTVLSAQRYEAPITVYPTYEDYKSNTGNEYVCDYMATTSGSFGGGYFYKFSAKKTACSQEAAKLIIRTKDVWGFKYGETLYRISPNGLAMHVTLYGDLVYYETCDYEYSMETFLPPNASLETVDEEITESAISENLNSQRLYGVMFTVKRKNREVPLTEIWEILKDKPNGEMVFNCIKEEKTYSELRECFKMLEK
jgi:hypothetical protein